MSCDDAIYKSSVPNMPVNFNCSLLQSPYMFITTPGQFLTVKKNGSGYTVNVPGQPAYTDGRVGFYFGYGGLIIGYPAIDLGGGSRYVAYDLACPLEAEDLGVAQLNLKGNSQGECPKCGTVYDLNTGFPNNGEGKKRLRTYAVYESGSTLTIKR